jgi:NTE family protein
MALHALNLLVARQLVRDAEWFSGAAELVIVPPLCPLATSAYDFSTTGALMDRAADATSRWLDRGGLRARGIPGALRPHVDEPLLRREPLPHCDGKLDSGSLEENRRSA